MAVYIQQLDHTGDAGFRVTAGSLRQLLIVLAEQMVGLCCPEGRIRRVIARPVRSSGYDLVELMVNWLGEINGLMAIHHELYSHFHLNCLQGPELSAAAGDALGDDPESTEAEGGGELPYRLAGTVEGEPIDPERHQVSREIKAVTFHEAFVRRDEAGWHGQVIFDL